MIVFIVLVCYPKSLMLPFESRMPRLPLLLPPFSPTPSTRSIGCNVHLRTYRRPPTLTKTLKSPLPRQNANFHVYRLHPTRPLAQESIHLRNCIRSTSPPYTSRTTYQHPSHLLAGGLMRKPTRALATSQLLLPILKRLLVVRNMQTNEEKERVVMEAIGMCGRGRWMKGGHGRQACTLL